MQTKRNCYQHVGPRLTFPFIGGQLNIDSDEGSLPPLKSSIESGVVWKITHNKLHVWPLDMFKVPIGPHSGYEHVTKDRTTPEGAAQVSVANSVRNGREIFVKGISLKIQFSLDKVVPWCNLKVMLVRSRKTDTPYGQTGTGVAGYAGRDSNFWMGYSQNKQLDMIDTARHKIIHTWNKRFRQNQFTTIGSEATADGQAVDNANPTRADAQLVVLKDAGGLTISEWLAKIELEYPDYAVFAPDQFNDDQDLSDLDTSLATLMCERPYQDLAAMAEAGVAVKYYIFEDSDSTNERYTWPQFNQYMTDTTKGSSGPLYPGATEKAYQVVLHRKVGAGAPSDDVIQYKHQGVMEIWIPGKMIKKGGKFRYEDRSSYSVPASTDVNSSDLEGAYEYNLLFFTYGNFQTWTIAGIGSSDPTMLYVNDFQSILYFRDP